MGAVGRLRGPFCPLAAPNPDWRKHAPLRRPAPDARPTAQKIDASQVASTGAAGGRRTVAAAAVQPDLVLCGGAAATPPAPAPRSVGLLAGALGTYLHHAHIPSLSPARSLARSAYVAAHSPTRNRDRPNPALAPQRSRFEGRCLLAPAAAQLIHHARQELPVRILPPLVLQIPARTYGSEGRHGEGEGGRQAGA